jgi:hypothetical protein
LTKIILWILAVALFGLLLFFGPWLTFWIVTTLFNTGATTFGFWQWLAALLFNLMFAAAGSWNKAK